MDILSGFFWRGVKTYRFRILEDRDSDTKMSVLRPFLERSGVTFSTKELSCEEAAKIVEKELLEMKRDLYSMKARGLSVPDAMKELYKRTEILHDSFAGGEKRMFELSVAVNAGMVDKNAAEGIIKRIKEIEQS